MLKPPLRTHDLSKTASPPCGATEPVPQPCPPLDRGGAQKGVPSPPRGSSEQDRLCPHQVLGPGSFGPPSLSLRDTGLLRVGPLAPGGVRSQGKVETGSTGQVLLEQNRGFWRRAHSGGCGEGSGPGGETLFHFLWAPGLFPGLQVDFPSRPRPRCRRIFRHSYSPHGPCHGVYLPSFLFSWR